MFPDVVALFPQCNGVQEEAERLNAIIKQGRRRPVMSDEQQFIIAVFLVGAVLGGVVLGAMRLWDAVKAYRAQRKRRRVFLDTLEKKLRCPNCGGIVIHPKQVGVNEFVNACAVCGKEDADA